jgi:predicted Zn finger-like uncharacterized protein
MMIQCPDCIFSAVIDDDKISDRELNVKCPKCQARLLFKKDSQASAQKIVPEIFRCPKCNAEQMPSETCIKCGLIFAKYRGAEQAPGGQNTNQDNEQKASPRLPPRPPLLKRPLVLLRELRVRS